VCPNCHAVIHRREPPFSIEEVKSQRNGSGKRPEPNKPFQPTAGACLMNRCAYSRGALPTGAAADARAFGGWRPAGKRLTDCVSSPHGNQR
jgi:hypothetical protein